MPASSGPPERLPRKERSDLALAAMIACGVVLALLVAFPLLVFGCAYSVEDRTRPVDEELLEQAADDGIWGLLPADARLISDHRTPGSIDGFFDFSSPGTIDRALEVDGSPGAVLADLTDRAAPLGWTVTEVECDASGVRVWMTRPTPEHRMDVQLRAVPTAPGQIRLDIGVSIYERTNDADGPGPTIASDRDGGVIACLRG